MIAKLIRSTGIRLTMMAAALFAVCTLALCVLIYLGLRDDMEDQLRDQVRNETRQLMGDYADDGLEELRHDISERLERNPGTRLQYTLVNADGTAIFDRLAIPDTAGWSRLKREGASDLLVLTTALDDGYRLGVAADTRIVGEAAGAFRHAMLIVLLPALLLSVVAGLLISRRFLSRVEQMKATADAVGRSSLSARMPVSQPGDEFDSLAGTINSMLDRIETLVHEVKYVSASVAHDLRTPLGHLRQRLEALAAETQQPDVEAGLESAVGLLDEVLATFAALLKIAELESTASGRPAELVDLAEIAAAVASAFGSIAESEGKQLLLEVAGPVPVRGDRQLITQMLVNLVENALHHNRDPVTVRICVSERPDGPGLTVSDNGVGIPDEELETVTRPFHRLDRSRSSRGSGLGLSLAASIARHHGASLVLGSNSPGLEVTIHFPKA